MNQHPTKKSGFWKELQRRRVWRSLAIYAGTAFIILEATSLIFPRWGLPDWTIDLVLYLLIFGALVNVVVAWFFDLTPDGVRKTPSVSVNFEESTRQESGGWKAATYISLVVIVVLIVFNVLPFGKQARAGALKSLIVLPSHNLTGADSLDFLVSGMHAQLVGDIGKISGLRVTGQYSSNKYKDVDMSLQEIASEADVEGAVETAVLCMGDSICIQVKVVRAFPEDQLWISEFKIPREEILNLNSQIARSIAEEVKIELTPEEQKLFARDRKVDRKAFVEYMRARQYFDDLSAESLYKARSYLENSIAEDPEWAAPYASLAMVWAGLAQMNLEAPEVAGPMIFGNLGRAMELDPDFPDIHFIQGILATWQEWNWEKGEKELLRAIAVNPNDAVSRAYYAHLLIILQRQEEAAQQARLAAELDPHNPLVLALCAVVLMDAGDHDAMREFINRALEIDPDHEFALGILGYMANYFRACGDFIHSVRELQPLEEEALNSIETACRNRGYDGAVEEYIHQMLLLEEKQGFVGHADLAVFYNHLNDLDKAVASIYKAVEMHDPNIPYIGTALFGAEKLADRPDYLAILDQMKLPHPSHK